MTNRTGRVVGRLAPSPTGRMHLGNIYAFLIAWLSARSQNGLVHLRIENLDTRAEDPRWTSLLLSDLEWLGLTWDGNPVYQRDRQDIYRETERELQAKGLLYPCFCTRAELHAASAPHVSDGTPIYPGTCRKFSDAEISKRSHTRPPAMRLIVPDEDDPAATIAFQDRVFGSRSENLAMTCGDFLIKRSDGIFAYQLAVVVDDAEMGITEIVRGRDLLTSVPRQIYLQRLLSLPEPTYAHIPLLTAKDGRRLSKRDRDRDMEALRERFETPERLLGWLAYTVGLTAAYEPRTADELALSFSWDLIRQHRQDIVAPEPPRE
ncbi:tRNA glutamyl-Q(34) synthetase GluQRS [Collinsella sp. AGMB00827]|uniref:Glutamyl-Q tRNA(Asp) synthetase n=1 Tax=Collinsella ureilytica TaxID=2869515 RepID=A0ABS7MJN8_9ACTN|nr:tRNA glutamyl-Q(34) synthetase GluQRS [Collinsella urealyticum]MBY4797533.1 tRNA glutamyl-Q(34) synthetase GluQRS [Collinsella urealyticum]